jgi:hypothetical protein
MDKRKLHELVDRLPESQTMAAARFLEFLIARDAPGNSEAWPASVLQAAGSMPDFPNLKQIRSRPRGLRSK